MSVVVVKSPIEVTNRLDELGTSREMLLEVIDAMIAARTDCTDNDPYGSRGWRGWQMGTRRNRELHVGISDWEKDDEDQVPSIISRRRGIRIVVCNTDDGTAVEARTPQNRSKKGSATDRAIDANQLSFLEEFDKAVKVVDLARRRAQGGIILTYYLCVYSEGEDRRGELSCPVNVENGFFHDFVERIFIVGGDSGPTETVRRKSSDDDDSEYSIPVTRKK